MIFSKGALFPVHRRGGWLVFISIIILLFQDSSIIAQEFRLGCQLGMGAYSMEQLKNLEQQLVSQVPGAKQKVADYPSYWFYQPSFSVNWNRVSLGLVLGAHSSGSRYSLVDYSGEYRFDSRITGNSFGALFKLKLNPGHPVNVSLYSEAGYISSTINMNEYFIVDEQLLVDESLSARSHNFYMEPGLEIACPIYFFIVAIQLGYCVQFGGDGLHGFYDGRKFELTTYKGPVKPEWRGSRIGGSLSFNLNRIFTSKSQ
jgi:hypothetical protein